jgi:hypothetical protein
MASKIRVARMTARIGTTRSGVSSYLTDTLADVAFTVAVSRSHIVKAIMRTYA